MHDWHSAGGGRSAVVMESYFGLRRSPGALSAAVYIHLCRCSARVYLCGCSPGAMMAAFYVYLYLCCYICAFVSAGVLHVSISAGVVYVCISLLQSLLACSYLCSGTQPLALTLLLSCSVDVAGFAVDAIVSLSCCCCRRCDISAEPSASGQCRVHLDR